MFIFLGGLGGVPVPVDLGALGLGGLGTVPFVLVGGFGMVIFPLIVPFPAPPPARALLLIKNCQLTAVCLSMIVSKQRRGYRRSLKTFKPSCFTKCDICPAPSLPPRAVRGGSALARLAVP